MSFLASLGALPGVLAQRLAVEIGRVKAIPRTVVKGTPARDPWGDRVSPGFRGGLCRPICNGCCRTASARPMGGRPWFGGLKGSMRVSGVGSVRVPAAMLVEDAQGWRAGVARPAMLPVRS